MMRGQHLRNIILIAGVASVILISANLFQPSEAGLLTASISLQKNANSNSVTPPTTITYTYQVTNDGDVELDAPTIIDDLCSPVEVNIVDDVGSGIEGDSNKDGVLDPGETWFFHCDFQVDFCEGTSITNTATASAISFDAIPLLIQDTDDDTVECIGVGDATLTKSIVGEPKVAPGTTVTYSYEFQNTGTTSLNCSLVDDKIGVIFTGTNMAPGPPILLAANAVLQDSTTNTATLTCVPTAGGNSFERQATFSVKVSKPDVNVIKEMPFFASAGELVPFNIVVVNIGNVPLSCTITDTFNGNVIFTTQEVIDSGFGINFPGDIQVDETSTNVADVICVDQLGQEVTASFSTVTQVIDPSVKITKTANVEKAIPGSPVEYTIIVENTGDAILFNCVVVDSELFGSIPIPDEIEPGQEIELVIEILIDDSFTNTATVTCDTPALTAVTDSDEVSILVVNPAIVIEVSGDEKIAAGSVADITYILGNTGTATLTCTVVDSQLGEVLPPTNLDPGEAVEVIESPTPEGDTTFTAQATCTDQLGNTLSVTDNTFVVVIHPSIDIEKVCTVLDANEPGKIAWQIITRNTGDTVLDATIEDEQCQLNELILMGPGELIFNCATDNLLGGTHTNSVTLEAFDQLGTEYSDSDTAECSINFSLGFRAEFLVNEIIALSLPDGISNSLIQPLLNILKFFDDGNNGNDSNSEASIQQSDVTSSANKINDNDDDPCETIQGVINKIQAQSGKKIDESDAEVLLEQARFIQELLECDPTTED